MNRISFYEENVEKWIKNRSVNILVVAGGETDCNVFKGLGFVNVTISNINQGVANKIDQYAPFKWCYQDAENLSFDENSFDFVIVHAALHHCFSPHRALLNIYRVAKQGVILFEARDNLLMRLAEFLGIAQTYEHMAVANAAKDRKSGGGVIIRIYQILFTDGQNEKLRKQLIAMLLMLLYRFLIIMVTHFQPFLKWIVSIKNIKTFAFVLFQYCFHLFLLCSLGNRICLHVLLKNQI